MNTQVGASIKSEIMTQRLELLRKKIQHWCKSRKEDLKTVIEAKKCRDELELIAESRDLLDNEKRERLHAISVINEWERISYMDLRQKSKARWLKFGDENSSFFHKIVNNHLSKNRINGLRIGGTWVTDPVQVKSSIMNYFKHKSLEPIGKRPKMSADGFKKLTEEQAISLIQPFSMDAIKWFTKNRALSFTFTAVGLEFDAVNNLKISIFNNDLTNKAFRPINPIFPL
ncbi:hypothetical protein L1987_23223 [Smallanthus sonchifolius]|uniref:Uncharacterized protein n=1 Tax=Smallanthus sonchifolius TaxID=185202 RepID=A0ACB9IJP1_9ASTR|nr:hypothetical protein L1987_23223 [Smallanthus sonchifolius]